LGGWLELYIALVTFTIEIEPEADGRWLAEVPALPGVMCNGADRDEAVATSSGPGVAGDRRTARASGVAIGVRQCHVPGGVSTWPSAKARRVLAGPLRIGRQIKRASGSHRTLNRDGRPDFVFSFHDDEEIGPRMLARLAKKTGLIPTDL
jgi:predicted RNA binding protein YcfA (HicA-like mRNA interferase family)